MGLKSRRTNTIEVQNVNVPNYSGRVDATKYADMKQALLRVLPDGDDSGFTQSEMMAAVKPHLSATLFPGGKTSGWWVKTVQLDLEAKGVLQRDTGKPLRWRRS